MIPKSFASFLILVSLLIVNLTFVAQRAPRAPAGRVALPEGFPFSLSGQTGPVQTGQGAVPHRAPITPAGRARRASRDSLKSQLSSPSARPIFFTTPTYASGGVDANVVAVGDVNGDGKLDLVVANGYADNTYTNGAVSVLLGNGDGTFQAPVSYGSGGVDAVSVAVADVNGDGKLDLVVANQCIDVNCANGSVSVLLGNGDGTFQPAVSYGSGGQTADSVAIGDVNGDGKPDLVVANQCASSNSCTNGTVAVLLGNGDGTFQTAVSYGSGGQTANSVAVGDVNGDGKPDLVVANQCASSNSCTNGTVAVLLGNGDGTFQAAVSYGSGGQTANSVAVGDVNGDGKPDLVVANQCASSNNCTNGMVAVLLGNGDGTFQPAVSYGSGGQTADSVAIGDVNGDGKPDLVVANQCTSSSNCANTVGVLLGNGDGTFQAAVSYGAGGSQAHSVAVGDVNGDSKLDLLVANQCASSSSCASGTVGVLLGNGDGTFQSPVSYGSGGSQAVSVAVADVNGDGNLDLMVANQCIDVNCATGSVSVLLGNGNGTFQTEVSYGSGGSQAYSVAVADINGDGKPDLVVANQCVSSSNCTNGTVAVLLGNGDGTFQPAVSYGSGGQTADSVAIGDVNGDGKPDLVVANQCVDVNCANGTVAVLLGNGDGTFQTAVSYGSGGQTANSVAIGDVNGDGKPDLVVANQCASSNSCTNGTVAVLLGNGDGTFQAAVSYWSGGVGGAYSVTVGDVNGDGKPDLVVANQCYDDTCTNGGVSVLLGNGDGTFQAAVCTPTLQLFLGEVQPLALADFDGDGKLDVASGGGNFLLLGNGDGTFQTPITLGAVGPGIAAGDFNRDGKPDSAVAGGGSVTVLRNIAVNFHYATTTAVTSSLNPAPGGQTVTFSATVTPAFNAGPLSGGVTFYDGANALGTVAITNGQAMFSTSSLLLGTQSITAAYTGDSNYLASTSPALLETINTSLTTATLISSLNPSTFGQSVTFTTTVTPSGGGTPTGTVTFVDGLNVLGVVSVSSGQAALSTSSLGAGNHAIVASYSGDSTYQASTSTTLILAVQMASTTTVVTSALNPAFINQTVTYTATITSQYLGIVSGSVIFHSGAASLGTVTLVNGQASVSASSSTSGSLSITASYIGDVNNTGSTSQALTEVVNKNPSSTTVAPSLNPSSFKQVVVFTATVTSGGSPTGTITFQSDTATLGTVALTGNTASLSTSALAAGVHLITAVYNGDATFIGSSSPALNQVVSKALTLESFQTLQNPSALGQAVTFKATVTSVGVPTGTVTFMNGGTTLASFALGQGVVTFSTAKLPVGSNTITANYGGAANYSTSSASLTQVVKSTLPTCCCSLGNTNRQSNAELRQHQDVQ